MGQARKTNTDPSTWNKPVVKKNVKRVATHGKKKSWNFPIWPPTAPGPQKSDSSGPFHQKSAREEVWGPKSDRFAAIWPMYAIVTPARVWNLAALGPGRPVSVSTRARRAKRAGFSPFAIARTAISTSTSPNKYKKRWAMSGVPEAETAKKQPKQSKHRFQN